MPLSGFSDRPQRICAKMLAELLPPKPNELTGTRGARAPNNYFRRNKSCVRIETGLYLIIDPTLNR